ncbi:MAG: gliding motility-associated C-terminal domain-containing protein [Cytophagaceae bacterium]|nr:gliding motility-associated C-terminal domain-containing protein [Cytophagaceae bacterium]
MKQRFLPVKKSVLFLNKLVKISLLVLLSFSAARAQYTGGCPPKFSGDQEGKFTASVIRGCAPLTVTVTKADAAVASEKYWFNFRGGDYKSYNPDRVARAATDTTYTRPGKYVILQFGSKGGTASFACQQIEVLPTPRPRFTAISCVRNQVTLTIPRDPAIIYDTYEVDWGDGSLRQNTTSGGALTHTYPNTNPRRIAVTGRYAGIATACAPPADTLATPAGNNPIRPTIARLELTGPTNARLTFSGQLTGSFDILQKTAAGTYQKIISDVKGGATTLQGLNNQTTQYCFKVANLTDACNPQPLESDELCSVPLTVTAQNQQNQITWTAYPTAPPLTPFRDYRITKNGNSYGLITQQSQTQSTDKQVECGVAYSYQVTARIGNMVSVSERKTVTAINTAVPAQLTTVYATVEQGKILLIWQRPVGNFKAFTVSRSGEASGNFQPVGDTTTNRYFDNVNPNQGPYCYTIGYQDLCGNSAPPSQPVCPVFLQQQGSSLSWTPYQTFPTGLLGYYLEQLDENGNVIGSLNMVSKTGYEPDLSNVTTQQLRYRVRAVATNGFNSYSNDITFLLSMKLFVPDAFSPNGDGINDTFTAKGQFIESFKMSVFNRWGEPLYQTDSIQPDQGWNGTFGGQPLAEGSYVYRIEIQDSTGETFVKRGALLLRR